MSKLFEFISFLHNVFYGEHWYIAWLIVLLLFVPAVISETPKLIKSIKASKKRNNKSK